jgi:hypothetical protein
MLVEDIINDPIVSVNNIIEDAVVANDVKTIKYFLNYIQNMQVNYFTEDPFYYWLMTALYNGSVDTFNFLISLQPNYLEDTIILSQLLKLLQVNQQQIGLRMLLPYIQEMNI